MLHIDGKKIKEVHLDGKKIKYAYLGSQLVYTAISKLKGFEAALDQMDFWHPYVTVFPPASVNQSVTAGSETSLHALIDKTGSVTVTQAGRIALSVSVSGGTVSVVSNGDRGQTNINFTGSYPGGKHLVSLSSYRDFSGYRLKLLIDGQEVNSATNGGAFVASENVLITATATISVSGSVYAHCLDGNQASLRSANTSAPWITETLTPGYVSWTYRVSPPNVPEGDTEAWLIQGGQGGQGGGTSRDGAAGSLGSALRYGKLANLALVTGVSAGSGGYGGSGSTNSRGSDGKPGTHTTWQGLSSASGTVVSPSYTPAGFPTSAYKTPTHRPAPGSSPRERG